MFFELAGERKKDLYKFDNLLIDMRWLKETKFTYRGVIAQMEVYSEIRKHRRGLTEDGNIDTSGLEPRVHERMDIAEDALCTFDPQREMNSNFTGRALGLLIYPMENLVNILYLYSMCRRERDKLKCVFPIEPVLGYIIGTT